MLGGGGGVQVNVGGVQNMLGGARMKLGGCAPPRTPRKSASGSDLDKLSQGVKTFAQNIQPHAQEEQGTDLNVQGCDDQLPVSNKT